jgi:two-component system sensor histidine kinase RegB
MAATAASEFLPTLNVRRLLLIRSIAIPGTAIGLALIWPAAGIPVATSLLLALAVALLAGNAFLWRRLGRGGPIGNRAVAAQLSVDLLALTAMLMATGGPANPLVLFYLLPPIIAAAILPQRTARLVGIGSVACYTGLIVTYRLAQAPLAGGDLPAVDLHTLGMWTGLVVITALVTHFVAAMAGTLRQRDRDLARAREAALRDEQLLAAATLATGAAHELSTPLATMAVVTSELAAEYPRAANPALNARLGVLRAQIARCKEALSVLSAAAGAARADHVERLRLREFVDRAVDEIHRLRPGARVEVLPGPEAGPLLALDRRAYQALLNVLNNAVDASPDAVSVACHWRAGGLEIAVADRGDGLAGAGQGLPPPGRSTKAGGLGLGLFISRAAVDQLGGELVTEANPAGGTTVRLRLASNRLTETTP